MQPPADNEEPTIEPDTPEDNGHIRPRPFIAFRAMAGLILTVAAQAIAPISPRGSIPSSLAELPAALQTVHVAVQAPPWRTSLSLLQALGAVLPIAVLCDRLADLGR